MFKSKAQPSLCLSLADCYKVTSLGKFVKCDTFYFELLTVVGHDGFVEVEVDESYYTVEHFSQCCHCHRGLKTETESSFFFLFFTAACCV